MEQEVQTTSPAKSPHHPQPEQQIQDIAFEADWQARDATILQPDHLAIQKVRRAWERKPSAPFSKQRLRVAKVWKRGPMAVERRLPRVSGTSPMKPVKKLCLDSHFGIGARVAQWERNESPARKIVTRSNADPAEMVALPEDDEIGQTVEEERGDITVEVLHEDGTVAYVGGANMDAEEQDWEDEDVFDDTMPLGDIFSDTPTDNLVLGEAHEPDVHIDAHGRPTDRDDDIPVRPLSPEKDTANVSPDEQLRGTDAILPLYQPLPAPANSPNITLPDGFISPAKRRPTKRTAISQPFGSRRRTLPVQFAPERQPQTTRSNPPSDDTRTKSIDFHASRGEDAHAAIARQAAAIVAEETMRKEMQAKSMVDEDGEWEDVEGELDVPGSSKIGDNTYDSLDAETAEITGLKLEEAPTGLPTLEPALADQIVTESSDVETDELCDMELKEARIDSPSPEPAQTDEIEINAPDAETAEAIEVELGDVTAESPAPKHATVENTISEFLDANAAERVNVRLEKMRTDLPDLGSAEIDNVAMDSLDVEMGETTNMEVEESTARENAMTSMPDCKQHHSTVVMDMIASDAPVEDRLRDTPMPPPMSPVPTIETQHPHPPVRESRRRQSSSPLKLRKIIPSVETSHLVAFTPMKMPVQNSSPCIHPYVDAGTEEADKPSQLAGPIERAASAPPAERQMSPQKPSKPRVSDDTALLQAFLNKAAESRNGRRMSATRQESITNRRDSDAVRQALASPPKTDVLGDLDPNSPSPRKQSIVADSQHSLLTPAAESSGLSVDDESDVPKARRSSRSTRRTQASSQLTPAAPNRISIRGHTDGVVLKKSEAQELALMTRNNTRKNKGGAVLPPQRLSRLASNQNSQNEDTTAPMDTVKTAAEGGRNVTWAERLVEFYQGGEVSDLSVLSNGSSELLHSEPISKSGIDASEAPPPSETPSKPKIRRLKPSRTASTPAKPTVAQPAPESTTGPEPAMPQAKPSTVKRRSRIATPAKGLLGTSLLPADIVLPSADPKLAPRKPHITKLPAPCTTSLATQGQENSIASPPKKKSGVSGRAPPSSKTFVPKVDFLRTKLDPPAAGGTPMDQHDAVLGLASPAKKAPRVTSGTSIGGRRAALVLSEPDSSRRRAEEVPGLMSPAKKRTRRGLE